MADNFGLKIGLEGEKEFKKALSEINQSFKILGSEMKLATSQFDKNDKSVDALTARNKVLRKEIDEQTTKIDTLRKALQNAADSFGENDRRTQNWQIQLNNAEAALNDMNRELDETEDAIKKGGEAAEDSGSKFENFGKILKTVGAAMGAVAVAAGAAAVKLGKEVIDAYADYEQLVGGVDTLFKDSSQEIQRYNRMMENREQIIKDCETVRKSLTDFAALDADIERQLEETQVVAELVKAAVKENASTAQSQEAYLKRYEALTERYEKAAAELERLQNLRTTKSQKDKAMALYIRTLKKQPVVLREWSDTIWTVMVEKALVHRNGEITFVFKNGTEVKVGE